MDEFEGFLIGAALACILGALLPNTAVTNAEWAAAVSVCAKNDGVSHVRGEGAIRSLKVICNNAVEAHPKVTP